MTHILQEALKQQKKTTPKKNLQISGTLGIPLGGQKIVEVPNRNSFVYVKLRDNQSEVIQAYNNQVAPSYGLPVIVERHGGRYAVVAVDTLRYQSNWNSNAPFLPRHGNTHSFDPDNSGGGDIVWVHSRQFMPSLIIPSGTLGANNVLMSSYTLKNDNGTWKYTGNTGTASLLPYKPTTGTQAVMALVYLDSVSGNPYFMVGSGSYFPESITGSSQVVPYIPQITNPVTQIPLAAIRLVTGTNNILWDNIYDVRQFIHASPSGTGGGSSLTIQDEGVSLGTADTLNFVGSNISVTLGGTVARVFVTGSAGGSTNLTGTPIGIPNSVVLTDSLGQMFTPSWLGWGTSNQEFIEFGKDVAGKESNAGKIGYETFVSGFLEIVGAGTSAGDRWVRLYDNAKIDSLAQIGGLQVLGLPNSWIYLNATGSAVGPNFASEKLFATGTDYVLGINGQTNESVKIPLSSFVPQAETNSADIFRCSSAGTSTFSGTISSKSGADVVYSAGFSGNENALVAANTNQLAKMRLYNTTRGTSALISTCNTATNTITLTATAPAGWTNGDTITIASQTVSGGGLSWVDLEITSGPTGKKSIFFHVSFTDTGGASESLILHPLSSQATSKRTSTISQVAGVPITNMALVPIVGNVFVVAWSASGASTATSIIREMGFLP